MKPTARHLLIAVAIGQALLLAAVIDPLFFPMIVLGPIITGAIAAARNVPYLWIAIVWMSLGLATLWYGILVQRDHEDIGFHVAITVIMPLLAGVGYGAVRLATRVRRPT